MRVPEFKVHFMEFKVTDVERSRMMSNSDVHKLVDSVGERRASDSHVQKLVDSVGERLAAKRVMTSVLLMQEVLIVSVMSFKRCRAPKRARLAGPIRVHPGRALTHPGLLEGLCQGFRDYRDLRFPLSG